MRKKIVKTCPLCVYLCRDERFKLHYYYVLQALKFFHYICGSLLRLDVLFEMYWQTDHIFFASQYKRKERTSINDVRFFLVIFDPPLCPPIMSYFYLLMTRFWGSFSYPSFRMTRFFGLFQTFNLPTPPETGHQLWTFPNRNKIKKFQGQRCLRQEMDLHSARLHN